MHVLILAGHSGAGKTTLLQRLIPELKARGQRVSVVKMAHRGLDVDTPGKDSWRCREAGAFEVLSVAPDRLVLQRQFEQPAALSIHHALAELWSGVDWALVEGFRDGDLPKLEVWRSALGRPVRYPHDPFVAAIASDQPAAALPEPTALPVFSLDDARSLADWMLSQRQRLHYTPPDAPL